MKIQPYQGEMYKDFPVITANQLAECDALFPAYLFIQRQQGDVRLTTSCCHVADYSLDAQRTLTGDLAECRFLGHNDVTACPFCGRQVTVKWLSKAGKRKVLAAWRPVVFLHAEQDTALYAQAFVARKRYEHPADLTAAPDYSFVAAYRLEPGHPVMWEPNAYSGGYYKTENQRLPDPFRSNYLSSWHYEHYNVIGFDALGRSCLRYSQYDAWNRPLDNPPHFAMFRYLSTYCLYPSVEVVMRLGLMAAVDNLVYSQKKNAAAMDWTQTDPRKMFHMTKPELTYWLGLKQRSVEDIGLYRRLLRHGQKVALADVAELDLVYKTELVKLVEHYNLHFRKTVRYLNRLTGQRCHGGWYGLEQVFPLYQDYLKAATYLHYDLSQEVVRYPRDLHEAHDTATKNRKLMELTINKQKFEKITEKLHLRYAFSLAGWHIRPPENVQEIIEEGNALSHCVGGYAKRHADGVLAILFLRSDASPDESLVTIEMNGKRMVQIHGYKNDYLSKESPSKKYAAIVGPWLEWVQAGSKRDKLGNPILPKKKEAKIV